MDLEELFTLEHLNEAFYKLAEASYWKEQTQRYHANLLLNNIKLQEEILSGKYKVRPTTDFKVSERGRIRDISAPALRDAIVQKVINRYILVPQLSKYFIYDNYASIEKRGTSRARKRVKVMLRRHINQYNDTGYIIQIDVKNFFGSIDHDILKHMLDGVLDIDTDIKQLLFYLIDHSSNSNVGLNLGAEIPQTLSGFYLSELDNYIKTVLGIKFYARYADDIIICVPTKEEARTILESIKIKLHDKRLVISDKKTRIVKLSHGFTYLKIKYFIDNGKIITCPVHSKVQRERRRLRKYRKLYKNGIISKDEAYVAYDSWRCNIVKECNHMDKTLDSIDKLAKNLGFKPSAKIKDSREAIVDNVFKDNATYLRKIKYYEYSKKTDNEIFGMDNSKWQRDFDFINIKIGGGIEFAIINDEQEEGLK